MDKKILKLVYLTLIICWCHCGAGSPISDSASLHSLLPGDENLQGWVAEDAPEIVKGEDLYLLINGGAEIYHEYGFKQALAISFKNSDGKYINLEIYQMTSDASAYGIYSFKTGADGEKIPVGQEALLEDYYLNFWKGDFVITLIGFDTSQTSKQGIIHIAKALDRKITGSGNKPPLIKRLKSKGSGARKIKYIRGNLGLFNQYRFDTANIFGVTEGVIGTYANSIQFIFQYKNNQISKKWYQHGLDKLVKSQHFRVYESVNQTPGFRDKNNCFFMVSAIKNYIFITMSKDRKHVSRIHVTALKSSHPGFGEEPH